MAEETTDVAITTPEEEGEAEDSVTELLEQLGRKLAVLVFYESRLAAARHKPEFLRAGRDVVRRSRCSPRS